MFKMSLAVLKNSLKVLLATGILLGLSTQAMASEPTEQQLAAEPPITQQDIDNFTSKTDQYIKIIRSPATAEAVVKELNMTEARFVVVSTKLSIGYTVILLTDLNQPIPQKELDALPTSLRPSEPEMALMKKNKDKIQAAFVKIGEAMEE